jgi:predicted CopG family antitoxin
MQKIRNRNSTTIRITWETYDKLAKLGSVGDTFDGVITKLLEQVRK